MVMAGIFWFPSSRLGTRLLQSSCFAKSAGRMSFNNFSLPKQSLGKKSAFPSRSLGTRTCRAGTARRWLLPYAQARRLCHQELFEAEQNLKGKILADS